MGAGPTGIFAAYEIKRLKPDSEILLVEMGEDLTGRNCPREDVGKCVLCPVCGVVSGFGGAGAFSDGKLNLTKDVGGDLASYIGEKAVWDLIDYVDEVYLEMGAPKRLYGVDRQRIRELKRKAYRQGLLLVPFRIRHMGSDGGRTVLENFRKRLEEMGVEFRFRTRARRIVTDGGRVGGVELEGGELVAGRYVIAAPGRVGAHWLVGEAERLGIPFEGGRVDLGVRVEVSEEVMREFTEVLYEPKLIYYTPTFDDKVRVFCVNPGGEVVTESYWGIVTVNGQARECCKTDNTNFALLVSTKFTEPHRNSIDYALDIARLANNIAGNQPLIQRLGDLRRGRRSTPERISRSVVRPTLKGAVAGDLSFVYPYRYLVDLLETLDALNGVMPGISSDHTLLYGVELKLHTAKFRLKPSLETETVEGLFIGGDAGGVSRGLVQASASGVVIGREISRRMGGAPP